MCKNDANDQNKDNVTIRWMLSEVNIGLCTFGTQTCTNIWTVFLWTHRCYMRPQHQKSLVRVYKFEHFPLLYGQYSYCSFLAGTLA